MYELHAQDGGVLLRAWVPFTKLRPPAPEDFGSVASSDGAIDIVLLQRCLGTDKVVAIPRPSLLPKQGGTERDLIAYSLTLGLEWDFPCQSLFRSCACGRVAKRVSILKWSVNCQSRVRLLAK